MLLPVSSLPGPEGIGTLGASAVDFLDWISSAGLRYWQVLPVCEGGTDDSPYSSPCSSVGSPWLIDIAELREQGLLETTQRVSTHPPQTGSVVIQQVKQTKAHLLQMAAEKLLGNPDHPLHASWLEWRATHPWMEDTALFQVLRENQQQRPWWEWPAALRNREPDAIHEAKNRLEKPIRVREVLAFLFDRQWSILREAAEQRGILLMGDLPIYVAPDSVDVWANPDLFELDEAGQPGRVAGVPPDKFSKTGQLWGNPLYDWSKMADDHYSWWVDRLQRNLDWTPVLRIDHFRGFARYWAVPGDAETAMEGTWVKGPGIPLFKRLREALGGQWLVAEDLGEIDASVHNLRQKAGLLSTRVLQFAFGAGDSKIHLPENCPPDSVLYTATHDNDTTLGWWSHLSDQEKSTVLTHLHCVENELVDTLVQAALGAQSQVVILAVQDILRLGSEARINTPGTTGCNWQWRMSPLALDQTHADRVLAWVTQADR